MSWRTLVVACAAVLLPVVAWAWNEGSEEQDEAMRLSPDLVNGKKVFEICTACHLPHGWGAEDGSFPLLAGQHRTVIIKQLADIRARNRDNPTMYPFSLPDTIGGVQSIADVAAYIESLPARPENGKGPYAVGTAEYQMGKQLYQEHCVACHGEQGEGDSGLYYPKLNGQHYRYMLRQFEWIRDGKRRNANPAMEQQIRQFSDDEMKAVVNYVSYLPVADTH
ncbi:MAG TPA: cytochrome C [Gammaproteobacteria bacterium]|nr:cytochrome C [Gammaproteobacteria bacterium]